MIAPEEWYEMQRQYQKYGIDMQPQSQRESLRERREKQQKQKSVSVLKERGILTEGDRRFVISLVMIIALTAIMVVYVAAQTAELTYEINKIKAENDVLTGEIEDIDVSILSASTITYVEEEAKSKLHMKSPSNKNCVFISNCDVPEEGFADILMEKAYE